MNGFKQETVTALLESESLRVEFTVGKFVNVFRLERALFGDDGRDIPGRSHVEGRVCDLDPVGRNLNFPEHVGHFTGIAFLDGDVGP